MSQSKRIPQKKLVRAAASVVLVTVGAGTARAATVTWNNASTPGLWSNSANWTGGTGIPVAGDTVNFTGIGSATTSGTLTNEVDQSFTISSLNYSQQTDAAMPQF